MECWRKPLENAFKDIGDISGFMIFDAGTEGLAARFLAERIGDGRIIGTNKWIGFYKTARRTVRDLLDKVVLIKDDMRFIDYLKDGFFDLVVSYDTIASIERSTPDGATPILRQFYRILKQKGRFLAIESPPLEDIEPLDEAQQFELELSGILQKTLERPSTRQYKPSQLSEVLSQIGFENIRWRMVSQGYKLSPSWVRKEVRGWDKFLNETVENQEEKERLLKRIQEIRRQVKRTGLRSLPYYALYARKP